MHLINSFPEARIRQFFAIKAINSYSVGYFSIKNRINPISQESSVEQSYLINGTID